jgi:hypothetical protein
MAAYLGMKAPTSLTPQGWQTFFSGGETLVGNLASDFRTWSTLLNEAIKGGTSAFNVPETEAYRDALGRWVSDQQQEATLSKACVGAGVSSANVSGIVQCYEGMVAKYYSKWQADASKLNSLGKELQGASG